MTQNLNATVARRILAFSAGTGGARTIHTRAYGGGPPPSATPLAPSGPSTPSYGPSAGATLDTSSSDAAATPDAPPPSGLMAKASAFVAENKTAVYVAGGVGVVAVGVALFLALRK